MQIAMRWVLTVKRAAMLMLLLSVALSLSACSKELELTPLAESATVLAFGDSLTAGLGVTATDAYPVVLQSLSGRTVILSLIHI